MRKMLLTSLLLCGISHPVMAQTQEADRTDPYALEEIIVTAERRETTVQRSSLSIQVLSAKDVEAVRRPADLNQLVPGVQIGSTGVNPQIYIRGVGDAARNSRAQPGVQFNLDGVALARPSLASTSFFDLERVEVLKGPQGTLYGRNASGGAVNLISARPRIGETSGSVSLEAGSFNLLSSELALNVPLGQQAALRISGKGIERDGYLSDGAQDQRTRAVRGRILVEPSSAISILASVDYSAVRGQGSGVGVYPVFQNDPWYSNNDVSLLPYPYIFGPGTAPFTRPDDRSVNSDSWGVSAEINANLGFATLTVIPAYREHVQNYVSYNANIRFKEYLDDRATSVEVRLANDGTTFKWIVGAFYYDDQFGQQVYAVQGTPTGPALLAQLSKEKVVSKSLFANVTYALVPDLRVIGGIRYTHETNGGTLVTGTGARPEVPFVQLRGPIDLFSAGDKRINWKAGLEYDVGAASMLYLTGTTGFKGGGTNTTPCGGPSYEPERITQFLAGSRNRFFGNRLQVNGEAFLIKARGQHVSALADVCGSTPGSPSEQGFLTFNVGKATIYGANIDLAWAVTDADKLKFFAEYTKSKADSFVFTQIGLGAYAPAQASACSASPASVAGRFTIDCSGRALPRVPSWSLQGSYQHDFELNNGGRITPLVNAQYVGSRLLDVGYGPNSRVSGYSVVNFELSYTAPDDAWSLSAYAMNLTNEAIYTSGTSIGANAPNGFRYYTVNIEAPRNYGVRLSSKF
ncbi:TonB-dependent receptor [Sphingobium sp. MK2]|uniref:TonB-dependent receptor n=1 Tax=Sphingobium sp. MK2 TaxID=3116540 RepID=UPI0032E35F07